MNEDKLFLTYNQQMKKLRNDKHIECKGSSHKKILIRAGYFNIVNGYKTPFVSGRDSNGNHSYISGTSINQLQAVKNLMINYVLFYFVTLRKLKRKHVPFQDTNLMSAIIMAKFLGTTQTPMLRKNLCRKK